MNRESGRGAASGPGGAPHSCLYRGTLRHRRLRPAPHAFRTSLYLLYLDLDELPRIFDGRWLWSARGPALAWFRRADFLGGRDTPRRPLDVAVRDLVEARTGTRPAGPIRLLTQLRHVGVLMNPVSFYYCFDAADARVVAIVAEITNTPWGERHAYVLATPAPARRLQRFSFRKGFHVSPFMPMEHDYHWRFSVPGERLLVHMENHLRDGDSAAGEPRAPARICFDATLSLRRVPLGAASLAGALLRFPLMSAQVALGIYWNALRLWQKGAPFHTHPRKRGLDVRAPLAR